MNKGMMTYDDNNGNNENGHIVEATSLSAITSIASSPPRHPRESASGSRQPLVLYIARVPGSRDVFLTPLKPREKVVSAEDVRSSLYYVHIHGDADREVLQSARRTSADVDASQLATTADRPTQNQPKLSVSRKEVPLSLLRPMASHMPEQPPFTKTSQPISRKPVNDAADNEMPPPVPRHVDLSVIPPRPLPKPAAEHVRGSSLHDHNRQLLRQADHSEDNNPYFRSYESQAKPEEGGVDMAPGSLTLIRRDPALSEQWNVASIHDPPVYEICSPDQLLPALAKRTKRGDAPVYLDISNPGYAQFVDKERPGTRTSTSTQSSDSEPLPEGVFRRRLYMPGSRYGEHSYSHSRNTSTDSSSTKPDMPRSLRNRMSTTLHIDTPVATDRRSRSYTFTSPWHGKCEFSTGTTGKSLKCRHTLNHQVQDVSELRFNLPTSSKHTTPATLGEKRASYFSRHTRHDSWDDGGASPGIILDDEGKVDLSLGQEKAGGGFGGKQAKLGKLIIEAEGLEMLDLLVAANVGLWWRAYERV
ncbi:hypothetical protein LTR62_002423 [Meristemomyces frigidus]|uniref:Uncharacterized protein n=1 Tax=Meristemomyces frigidus TaxID=1508187 RepID=A0AAN7YS68_9PEZI|nr:hypothetical protein LTR62_002423 [Meristemomyces frigidus]